MWTFDRRGREWPHVDDCRHLEQIHIIRPAVHFCSRSMISCRFDEVVRERSWEDLPTPGWMSGNLESMDALNIHECLHSEGHMAYSRVAQLVVPRGIPLSYTSYWYPKSKRVMTYFRT